MNYSIQNSSEEDIKAKIIIPFLKECGFGTDELTFESSFILKLGRNWVTKNKNNCIGGRLDILVKLNEKNLFVIEVKRDSKALDEEDKTQAISYARLIHPMAPFAITTNGKDTRIYNSITQQEVDKGENFRGYKIEGPHQEAYEEALQFFIGYSKENMKLFCAAQIERGMRTVKGSFSDRDKKFIPEIFVPRQKLRIAVGDFLTSSKSVMAIVSESGQGKTCELCGLAESLVSSKPTLFFSGIDIGLSLYGAIATEFNWEFSQQLDSVSIIKKLQLIQKEPLIIIVDGIDEWQCSYKLSELGRLAGHPKHIRLIVSCKSRSWEDFEFQDGSPTQFAVETMEFYGRRAFFLGLLQPPEFFKILDLYRKLYDFKGLFQTEVLEESKQSLFLLRILHEVRSEKDTRHITYAKKDFFDAYLKAVQNKFPMKDRELVLEQMKGVAKTLVESGKDYVPMVEVRTQLGLKVNEQLLPALFEKSVLEEQHIDHDQYVGFYFQKLRDYLVAFKVKKFEKLSEEELKIVLAESFNNSVLYDALKLQYALGNRLLQGQFDQRVFTNAKCYTQFYQKVLDLHPPSLKLKFVPFKEGNIGFVGEYSLQNNQIGMHGFRSRESHDEIVKLLPVDGGLMRKDTNLAYLEGAESLHVHSMTNGFIDFKIEEAVMEVEVLPQIKKLIEEGDLVETECPILSRERVLGCLNNLGYNSREVELAELFPISFDDVRVWIRFTHFYRQLQNELVQKKIASGEIKELWCGSSRSYSVKYTEAEQAELKRNALENANDLSVSMPETPDFARKKLETYIEEGIKTLWKKQLALDTQLIPKADIFNRYVHGAYKPENLKKVLKELYEAFLHEYKALLETNFPNFLDCFGLYQKLPCLLLIEALQNESDGVVKIYYSKLPKKMSSQVIICEPGSIKMDCKKFKIIYKETEYDLFASSTRSLGSLLVPSVNQGPLWNYPYGVLRALIYGEINKDLDLLFKKLKNYVEKT